MSLLAGLSQQGDTVSTHNDDPAAHDWPDEVIVTTQSSFGHVLPLDEGTTTTTQGGTSAGYRFTLANDSPLIVTHLGREILQDGTNYTVNLFDEADTATPIATGVVLNTSSKDATNFRWVKLATPVTLQYGHQYRLAANEVNGYKCRQNQALTASYVSKLLTGLYGCWGIGSYPSTLQAAGTVNGMPAMKFSVPVQRLAYPRPVETHCGTSDTQSPQQAFLRNRATLAWTMDGTDTRDFLQIRSKDETASYWPVKTRIGPYGEITTNAWVVIAGVADMAPVTNDPCMLAIRPDVETAIQAMGGSSGVKRIFCGVSYAGKYVFAVRNDGGIMWGNGTKEAHDVGFSRIGAGKLALGNGTDQSNSGELELSSIVLKSARGTRYRVTVTDAGVLSVAAA